MRGVGPTISSEAVIKVASLRRAEATNKNSLAPDGPSPALAAEGTQAEGRRLAFHRLNEDPYAKKAFVRNIADDAPDSLIESLLGEVAEVVAWSRTRDANGKCVNHGLVQFRDIEGLLRVHRVFPKVPIFGKRMELKFGEKTASLISAFVETKKDEIKGRPGLAHCSDDEVGDILKDELYAHERAVLDKLVLVVGKFEEKRDKIMRNSSVEKNTIVECAVEKMSLFKQKHNLLNEKELNEAFSKELQGWLLREEGYAKRVERELEEERGADRRKRELVEEDRLLRENDFNRKNDRVLGQWLANRKRRREVLEEDRLRIGTADKTVDVQLGKRRELAAQAGQAKENQADAPPPKRVKFDVIQLQPTKKEEARTEGLRAEPGLAGAVVAGQPVQGLSIDLSLQTPLEGPPAERAGKGRPTVLPSQFDRDDNEDPVFTKAGLRDSRAVKQIQESFQAERQQEENLERRLMMSAH